VVFCPKYRYRVLSGEVGEYVKQELYRLCRQKEGVEVIEANVQADHVQVVLSILRHQDKGKRIEKTW
jgi:putative transposase